MTMEITLTCPGCGSGVHIRPTEGAHSTTCHICSRQIPLAFTKEHLQNRLDSCPSCLGKIRKNLDKSKVTAHNLGQIGAKHGDARMAASDDCPDGQCRSRMRRQAGTTEAYPEYAARSDGEAEPQDGLKCGPLDFYQQKDFNRKWGVGLFIAAAILSFWTYGVSLIALYLADLWLFKKLPSIAICYHCQAIFREVENLAGVPPFEHYKHDRIRYASPEEAKS